MIRRITILTAIALLAIPAVASAQPRTPTEGFFKSLAAPWKVSCSTVRKVIRVWNGQEFRRSEPRVACGGSTASRLTTSV